MLKLILKTSFYSVKNNHSRSINFIEMGQNNHSRHSYRFLPIILNSAVFFLLTEFPLHISPPGLRRIKLNISSRHLRSDLLSIKAELGSLRGNHTNSHSCPVDLFYKILTDNREIFLSFFADLYLYNTKQEPDKHRAL